MVYINKKKFFIFLLFFLAILLLAGKISSTVEVKNKSLWGKITAFWEPKENNNSQEKELNKNFPMPVRETDRFDTLLLGIRGAEDTENGGLLSDSIMLFSSDKTTGKLSLVSIPRDLYVNLPGVVKGKANEVYEKGLIKKNELDFTKNAFSRITGVYIDNLIVFDFQGFKEIVDTVGGIDIELKQPFEEKNQWGYEFSLPAGKNHLNGETALYYTRSRYSSSDFDRSRRQQNVIFAIKEKAFSLGILGNPLKVNALISSLKNNIETDFNILDTKSLLDLALDLNSSSNNLETKTMSTENALYETKQDELYILLPQNNDWSLIKNFFVNN